MWRFGKVTLKMTQRRTIALAAGYWSTNIGNAFFNLGTKYVLENALPGWQVRFVSDMPGYWSFWNKSRGNPPTAANVWKLITPDYIVLNGPCLTRFLGPIWSDTLEYQLNRGAQLVILSAGQMEYTKEEVSHVREVLRRYRPVLLTSRDRTVYETFGDLAESAYDGIDTGFFASDYHPRRQWWEKPYIVSSFDYLPEPRLVQDAESYQGPLSARLEIGGKEYRVVFPRLDVALSRRWRWWRYLKGALRLDHPEASSFLDGYLLVRPEHRANPMFVSKTYAAANGFVSDIPYTYLDLYSNAELILSDRVHACVAALAYGRRAVFFGETGRSRLLGRLLPDAESGRVLELEESVLAREKQAMIRFVQTALERA